MCTRYLSEQKTRKNGIVITLPASLSLYIYVYTYIDSSIFLSFSL